MAVRSSVVRTGESSCDGLIFFDSRDSHLNMTFVDDQTGQRQGSKQNPSARNFFVRVLLWATTVVIRFAVPETTWVSQFRKISTQPCRRAEEVRFRDRRRKLADIPPMRIPGWRRRGPREQEEPRCVCLPAEMVIIVVSLFPHSERAMWPVHTPTAGSHRTEDAMPP